MSIEPERGLQDGSVGLGSGSHPRGAPESTKSVELPRYRRWVIFTAASVTLLMSSLDQTIVATALHALQDDLHASVNWAGWTLTIYALGQVLVLPLAGKLSDLYGRRRVFLAAVVVFTLASLACGLANDIYTLVALRAVQAIGGGAFVPSATGIVVAYSGEARDRAVGLFGSFFSIGAIMGPVLGGVFVAYWSWRGIFLVNVPLGLAIIPLCIKYIPRDTIARRSARGRVDLMGMSLVCGAVLSAMLGVSYLGGQNARVWSVLFVVPEVVAVLAFALFLRHSKRVPDPFISPRLMYGRGFGIMNVVNFLFGGAVAGLGALVPLYATERYGIDVLNSGTLLSARGICDVAVGWIAALALRRTGYRWPMIVGFLTVAVGMFALAVNPIGMSPYAWLATAAAVTGIGIGISDPASRNASLQMAPDEAAAIAGLRSTCRRVGTITTISIATAIIAQSSNPGLVQARIFEIFVFVLLAVMPFLMRVPEHRGTW